jgi:hypothetical protein
VNWGIRIHPDLVVELNEPQACAARARVCVFVREGAVESKPRVHRSFAFNDNSAIAAISAFQDVGLRVPENVSVIGFDDIPLASYSNPTLTTVRQPLQKMGEIAARTLLDRIENRSEYVAEIAIETRTNRSTVYWTRSQRNVAIVLRFQNVAIWRTARALATKSSAGITATCRILSDRKQQ